MTKNNPTYRLLLAASHTDNPVIKRRLVRSAAIVRKAGIGGSLADAGQVALDAAGFIPGVGEFADGANALISLARGDFFGAAMSVISMIPEAGDAVGKGGKVLRWLLKIASKEGKLGKIAEFVLKHGKEIKTVLKAFVEFAHTYGKEVMRYIQGIGGMFSGNVPVTAPDKVKRLALDVGKTPALHSIAKKGAPAYGQMASTTANLLGSAPAAMKTFEQIEARSAQEAKAA